MRFIFSFILLLTVLSSFAQTHNYAQLWSDVQFNNNIRKNWIADVNLGATFSNTVADSKLFEQNIQNMARVWIHHEYSVRWKFSAFVAYFVNKEAPEIGQYYSPEWRGALQGTYYFLRGGLNLSTRMRPELRYIANKEGVFETVYRYRQQVKFTMALNGTQMQKGIGYLISTEELMFRSVENTKGFKYLDRNRFAIGLGYWLTKDTQVECVYVNEYLLRDSGNQLYNAISMSLVFNNIFTKSE
jgi:hypothetical protein